MNADKKLKITPIILRRQRTMTKRILARAMTEYLRIQSSVHDLPKQEFGAAR